MCEKKIDGHAESASARYVGAGFCDECIQSKSLGNNATARSYFEQRAYSFKEHPALQEINWKVSEVLRFSTGQENDAIAMALLKSCEISDLKEARYELLCRVIDNINECQSDKGIPITKFNRSKRCDNINRCASDIVELFRYVSCLSDNVPSCLTSKIPPPPYKPPDQPKINEINPSVRRPIPQPRKKASPVISQDVSHPPSSTKSSPQPLHLETSESDPIGLHLNATQDPNATYRTPCAGHFPRTPFHLRFKSNLPASTSSPLNANAPAFFPPNFTAMSADSMPSSSTEQSMASVRIMIEEMQSEIRHLKLELGTYKGLVDDMRLRYPTVSPPPQNDQTMMNWAAAEKLMQQLSTELAKPPASPQLVTPPQNLIDFSQDAMDPFSPFVPSESKLNAPPVTSPYSQVKQDLPAAMLLVQKEMEWMLHHMNDQDHKMLNLQLEFGNLKEDIKSGVISPPTASSSPRATEPKVTPPPAHTTRSDGPGTKRHQAPPPPETQQNPPPQPSIPIPPASDHFEGFNDEDANIYDVDPSPQPAPRPKPAPRPRPRHGTAPTQRPVPAPRRPKRRPKVSTVGSSMVANQQKRQIARGLDAKVHAHSGEKAQQIQPRINEETSPDDDYIILAGGTNNVPREYVVAIIRHIGNLIDHTREVRPTQQIIIPQLLHRYDNKYWRKNNEKINRVNGFLRHRCSKDPLMHFLPLDNITPEELYDNLHMDYGAKEKYADAVAAKVFELEDQRA